MSDQWDSIIDFGGSGGDQWESVVDFGDTATATQLSPYEIAKRNSDAIRAMMPGAMEDQINEAIYQNNVANAAKYDVENRPRGMTTGNVFSRTAETAANNIANRLGGPVMRGYGYALDAVGLDSMAQDAYDIGGFIHGRSNAQAATQAELDKQGWLGETATSWTRQGGAGLLEAIGIGLTGVPATAAFPAYFGISSADEQLAKGHSATEAMTHGAIDAVWGYLGAKLGAPLGKVAGEVAGEVAGREVGPSVTERAAQYVASKIPISESVSKIVVGTNAQVAQAVATESSKYLADVQFGRDEASMERYLARIKGTLGPAIVGGIAGEWFSNWTKSMKERVEAMPIALKAFMDAQSYDGDEPPTDRRGFREATGRKGNQEYREAFAAAVASRKNREKQTEKSLEQGFDQQAAEELLPPSAREAAQPEQPQAADESRPVPPTSEPQSPSPPPEQATEAPRQPKAFDLTVETIPEKLEVEYDAIRSATGEKVRVKGNAREAWQEHETAANLYKALLDCLRT